MSVSLLQEQLKGERSTSCGLSLLHAYVRTYSYGDQLHARSRDRRELAAVRTWNLAPAVESARSLLACYRGTGGMRPAAHTERGKKNVTSGWEYSAILCNLQPACKSVLHFCNKLHAPMKQNTYCVKNKSAILQ